MLVTLEVYASIHCDACNVRNPLPGLRASVSCKNCNAPIVIVKEGEALAKSAAHRLFGSEHDVLAMAVVRSDGDLVFDPDDKDRPRIGMFRNVAACVCKSTLPIPNEGDASITCPSCKDVIAVRWPDEVTKKYDARLWCVVGDTNDHAAPAEDGKARDAKAVTCSACGGPLTIDENHKAATCTYCHATNMLSDAQRLRLSPKPTDHRFFMLYRIDDALLRSLLRKKVEPNRGYELAFPQHETTRARLLAELDARAKEKRDAKLAESGPLESDDAHAMAQREDLTDEQARQLDGRLTQAQRLELRSYKVAPKLVAVWATSESVDLRSYAAAHLDPKDHHLNALVRDPEASVRLSVANRDDICTEHVEALVADTDASVATAAKKNPKHVPGFFEKIFS